MVTDIVHWPCDTGKEEEKNGEKERFKGSLDLLGSEATRE